MYFFYLYYYLKQEFQVSYLALLENIKTGEKNNWNLSSSQYVNLASSLSTFIAQSSMKNRITNSTAFNLNNKPIIGFLY